MRSDFTLPPRILSTARASDLRGHPRVPLVLTIRLRWFGALGLVCETSETLDTSRGGLLTSSQSERRVGTPVWVTLPFDSEAFCAVPEFPGKVAHSRNTPTGGHLLGIAFQSSERADDARPRHEMRSTIRSTRSSYVLPKALSRNVERRSARFELALPVFVRRSNSPWPDEGMSINVAAGSILFCTLQVYELGEPIEVELPDGPDATGGRREARVVRIARFGADQVLQQVAAEFTS
jgi:hypothetical protein